MRPRSAARSSSSTTSRPTSSSKCWPIFCGSKARRHWRRRIRRRRFARARSGRRSGRREPVCRSRIAAASPSTTDQRASVRLSGSRSTPKRSPTVLSREHAADGRRRRRAACRRSRPRPCCEALPAAPGHRRPGADRLARRALTGGRRPIWPASCDANWRRTLHGRGGRRVFAGPSDGRARRDGLSPAAAARAAAWRAKHIAPRPLGPVSAGDRPPRNDARIRHALSDRFAAAATGSPQPQSMPRRRNRLADVRRPVQLDDARCGRICRRRYRSRPARPDRRRAAADRPHLAKLPHAKPRSSASGWSIPDRCACATSSRPARRPRSPAAWPTRAIEFPQLRFAAAV